MAIAQCKISFELDYTSSVPLTNTAATVTYEKIPASGNPTVINNLDPDSVIDLPVIQTPGTYDLKVDLATAGASATKTSTFTIGNCSSCEKPKFNSVYLLNNGQIAIDYSISDISDLVTPEYQIATDSDFNDIIQIKIDFDYTQVEHIFMNNGNYTYSKDLYIRIRKHCYNKATGGSGVSDWSNVMNIKNARWIPQKAPYTFDAYCVSWKFEDPITTSAKICTADNTLLKKINLNTVTPQVGSFIYLADGNTLAIPPSLADFDTGGASTGFNESGIRWIRFANDSSYTIYNVEKSGKIIGVSSYNCNT